MLSDRIFVRHKDRMVKIYLDEFLYTEADWNYCRIFTPPKDYMLATSHKTMEDKLSLKKFVRVHRGRTYSIWRRLVSGRAKRDCSGLGHSGEPCLSG